METLQQYQWRTRGFMMDSLPHEGNFITNPNLEKKVNKEGKFLPFIGDTSIFYIDKATQNMVEEMQTLLYKNCSDMLAEVINPNTFHATLHDLSNGFPSEELWQQMEKNKQNTKLLMQEIEKENRNPIKVRTVSVLNMVNTAVVLGLEPVDDDACFRLMELHQRFQAIVELNYPLTLHITLGYYKPGTYSSEQRLKLMNVFSECMKYSGQEICLDEKKLFYQWFNDMSGYYS